MPHVHVHYNTADGDREVETWTSGYVMKLRVGQPKDGRLPVELYLCLPKKKQGWLAGTFTMKPPDE